MKIRKIAGWTLGPVFGVLALGAVAASIDIATNDDNGSALPAKLGLDFKASKPVIDPKRIADFYIEAADTRAAKISVADTNGETKNFELLHSVDDDKTGFTASAYKEVNGNRVVLVFNGMSKPWVDSVNTPHENPWQSWDDLLTGVESRFGIVNRQMGTLYDFMKEVHAKAGSEADYEAIGYSLGGIHGLHAKAVWGIPFTGLSPAGLPNHPKLYTAEQLKGVDLPTSFSYSTASDFITGSVGPTGPIEVIDLDKFRQQFPNAKIDSAGPHIFPPGYQVVLRNR